MDEQAIAAFRLTFVRTLDEGETIDEFEKIPRVANNWPEERDFKKWPTRDQQNWVTAVTLGYVEDELEAGGHESDQAANMAASGKIIAFLKHVGIDLDDPGKLGDLTDYDLLLAHYSLGKGYDCEQVVVDYCTFPPIAELVRKMKKEQRDRLAREQQTRREQAKTRKRRWRERGGQGGANGAAEADGLH